MTGGCNTLAHRLPDSKNVYTKRQVNYASNTVDIVCITTRFKFVVEKGIQSSKVFLQIFKSINAFLFKMKLRNNKKMSLNSSPEDESPGIFMTVNSSSVGREQKRSKKCTRSWSVRVQLNNTAASKPHTNVRNPCYLNNEWTCFKYGRQYGPHIIHYHKLNTAKLTALAGELNCSETTKDDSFEVQ